MMHLNHLSSSLHSSMQSYKIDVNMEKLDGILAMISMNLTSEFHLSYLIFI